MSSNIVTTDIYPPSGLYNAEATMQTVGKAKAADMLGISEKLFAKARKAETIPDLRLSTISQIAEIPVLTEIYSPENNDLPIPVLRMGNQEESYDQTRRYAGYHTDMHDGELCDAADRWWSPSGSRGVLDAGSMLVAHGSFIVAMLRVWRVAATDHDGYIHYDASLIARCSDFAAADGATIESTGKPRAYVARQWHEAAIGNYGTDSDTANLIAKGWGAIAGGPDTFRPWVELANDVVGMRVLGGGGGNITTLTGAR